jgi:hypothetical protein
MEPMESVDETSRKPEHVDTHHLLDHQQKRLSSTEVLFGGVRNCWDRESILSTYLSNLDNNPTTIGSSRRRKKKNQLEYAETGKSDPSLGQDRVSSRVLQCVPIITHTDRGDAYHRKGNIEARKRAKPEERKCGKSGIKQDRKWLE